MRRTTGIYIENFKIAELLVVIMVSCLPLPTVRYE